MIIGNRFFVLALATVVLQQLLIAGSTWSIALAGAAVPGNDYASAKFHIVLFFMLALAAYVTSSVTELLGVDAGNLAWKRYVEQTLDKACHSAELGGESNRRATAQWLSAEALSTIAGGTGYYIGALSTLTNILFTGAVFYFSLGVLIGSAVAASLMLSLLFVYLARSRISQLASAIQNSKMSALSRLDGRLVNGFFGTRRMAAQATTAFEVETDRYFGRTRSYARVEQLVACIPIAMAVVIVSVAVSRVHEPSAVELGMLVAVLPRSLQLFGNVHSLSLYLSQFISVNQQFKNLDGFVDTLQRQAFAEQIRHEHITIVNARTGEQLSTRQLLDLAASDRPQGRFRVQGPNGAGKSSLLGLIKGAHREAILLTPGARFNSVASGQSTGQMQIAELERLLLEPSTLLLLDEWDANLDQRNIQQMEALLSQAGASRLIVEVRHRHASADHPALS